MTIEFSEAALRQISDAILFIAADKPEAAKCWVESVRTLVSRLADFPRNGRVVPDFSDENLRELLHGEYRVVYKIDERSSRVVVVTVFHAKRLLPQV